MRNKIGKVIFAAILLLSLWLAFNSVAYAQTPTPPPTRESLIEEIKLRAQRDVDNGKPMEHIEGLTILFGEQAKQAGISPTEMLQIYEDE